MASAGNPFLVGKHRPIVVGHRGVPKLHQENTLAGFRRAIELGLPAVELDVRLTKDRRAVVLHDHELHRLTGSAAAVTDLTWDQLCRLRIRRELPMGVDHTGAEVIVRYDREEPIPLLAEVLAEVSNRVLVNVELKLHAAHWWKADVGAITADVIADASAQGRVIVTSFDPRKLAAARRRHPDLAVGFCFDDSMLDLAAPLLERLPARRGHLALPGDHGLRSSARRMLNRILESRLVERLLGTQLVGAEHTLIGRDTVRRLHAAGIAIGTHTLFPLGSTTTKAIPPAAATVEEVHRLVELGVDWIESDDPERLQRLIG